MPTVVDTFNVIMECRAELARMKALAEDFRMANEMSRKFLSGAVTISTAGNTGGRPSCGSRSRRDLERWRARAEETRTFAEYVLLPEARRLLLEIADSYDRMAD